LDKDFRKTNGVYPKIKMYAITPSKRAVTTKPIPTVVGSKKVLYFSLWSSE
jgi:hypothetical protein